MGVGPVAPAKPYNVVYYQDGERKVIRRVPPPALHDLKPEDTVTITHKRNADWDEGDQVRVKAINPRQPNTLQVEKEDGSYTFMSYFDVAFHGRELQEDIVSKEVVARRKDPIGSNYLLWP